MRSRRATAEETGPPAPIRLAGGAARQLVRALSDDSLYEVLRVTGADCLRGFKGDRRSAANPVVRSRLVHELTHQPQLASVILEWRSAPWSSWRRAAAAFDEAWLLHHWRDLARTRANLAFLAAGMATDPRPRVAHRGQRLLRREALWKENALGTPAREKVAAAILPLLTLVRDIDGPPAAPSVSPPAAEAAAATPVLKREVEDLRQSLDRARLRLQQLQQEAEAKEHEWETQRREWRRVLKQSQDTLTAQTLSFEQQVAARTQEVRRHLLGLGLDGQPLPVAEPAPGAPLLERVAQVLDEHRRLNQAYASVATIRDEARQLDEAAHRLTECLAQSLVVRPQLKELLHEVEDRRENLRLLLVDHGRLEAPELVGRLMFAVQRATPGPEGQQGLDEIESLLQSPIAGDLLGKGWLERVGEAVRQRRGRLQAIEREQALAGLTFAPPPPALPRDIFDVAAALRCAAAPARVCLLVDGYNVSKNAPLLSELDQHSGLAEARRRLTELCRARANLFGACELVFDGDGAVQTREAHGALTVVFAPRRHEEQNADDYIAARAVALCPSFDSVWVVTNDQGLRTRTEAHCAGFISVHDFCAFLEG